MVTKEKTEEKEIQRSGALRARVLKEKVPVALVAGLGMKRF
jgi:hypothetical protein